MGGRPQRAAAARWVVCGWRIDLVAGVAPAQPSDDAVGVGQGHALLDAGVEEGRDGGPVDAGGGRRRLVEGVAGVGMDGVAKAGVGLGVDLHGARRGGAGVVAAAEVVHVGGVGPEGVDGAVVVVHALRVHTKGGYHCLAQWDVGCAGMFGAVGRGLCRHWGTSLRVTGPFKPMFMGDT